MSKKQHPILNARSNKVLNLTSPGKTKTSGYYSNYTVGDEREGGWVDFKFNFFK